MIGIIGSRYAPYGNSCLQSKMQKSAAAGNRTVCLNVPLLEPIKLYDSGAKKIITEGDDLQNDLYRNSAVGTISGLGVISGLLNLSSLITNRNTESCFEGSIISDTYVYFYQLNTMTQTAFGRPVYVTLETPEGEDVNLTLYDAEGNQVGMAEKNADGTSTLVIPCDWSTSNRFTMKMEKADGSSVGEPIAYRLKFREGEVSEEYRKALREADYSAPQEADPEKRKNLSERIAQVRNDRNEKEMDALHDRQFSELPEEERYTGKESVEELIERKRKGEILTGAEEKYIRIYGNMKDISDAENTLWSEDLQKEFQAACEEAGIGKDSQMHIRLSADGAVEVTGLTEEENQKAAEMIQERFAGQLKKLYLVHSPTVQNMTNQEYRIAMFADELEGFLAKASGGRSSLKNVHIVNTSNSKMIVKEKLAGLPQNISDLINNADVNSAYYDYQKMFYEVLNYRDAHGAIPSFETELDWNGEAFSYT